MYKSLIRFPINCLVFLYLVHIAIDWKKYICFRFYLQKLDNSFLRCFRIFCIRSRSGFLCNLPYFVTLQTDCSWFKYSFVFWMLFAFQWYICFLFHRQILIICVQFLSSAFAIVKSPALA